MTRFHALCPQLTFGQTVGSGHFCQLEVPDQVNAMIEHFLAITPTAGARPTPTRSSPAASR
jgi:hypothetical protein